MQTGKSLIPTWNKEEFHKFNSIIEFDEYQKVVSYLNKQVENRDSLLRLFFFPDIGKVAENIGLSAKSTIETMFFISSYYPSILKMEVFFQKDDEQIFAKVQEDDLEFLEEQDIFYNPEDPNIYYSNAKRFIRHAFCMGSK